MIGRKVKLTDNFARWHLDNPDCYFSSKGESHPAYETVMQYCIAHFLGQDIIGTIVDRGASIDNKINKYNWGVLFKTPYGDDHTYCEMDRDIILLEKK